VARALLRPRLVVAVAQLAAGLHEHLSFSGAVAFAGLFVPVWWAWTTYAYVADLFDADDGPFRAVLLGAMFLVAALAAAGVGVRLAIEEALGGEHAGHAGGGLRPRSRCARARRSRCRRSRRAGVFEGLAERGAA
jgi:Bacterial low temperature requirement A protein (LtrA)